MHLKVLDSLPLLVDHLREPRSVHVSLAESSLSILKRFHKVRQTQFLQFKTKLFLAFPIFQKQKSLDLVNDRENSSLFKLTVGIAEYAHTWRENIPGRQHSKCKVPEAGTYLAY